VPISLSFQVHGVHETTAKRTVTYQGRELQADVPVFVIELVNDDHGHTVRLAPDAAGEAEVRRTFQPGGTVTVMYSAGG
jgi:hypothetical protein